MKTYQQGDVLIQECNIPSDAQKVISKNGKFILAEGETTGHCHAVCEDNCQLYEKNGILYMRVDAATEVVHEEHKKIKIPAGDYIVEKVVEVDPFADEIRKVAD